MNTVTALILGMEVGVAVGLVALAAGAELGERAAARESQAAARRALRLTAADGFYVQFLAYRLGHRRAVDVPLRFERSIYTSSRTWGDA
ncbi:MULTISPECIES: hypothetical protein [Streptomyces]|uniref:hypothetical protein n=1 Tax=Streptomyces TaxID=1883 RepID=UPI00204AE9C6|nr:MULTISPECIES: hypothetical protein [Streptomyces]UPT41800.1 hypothetical protein MWG59_10370 [Streptomyces sp. WAC00303]WIY76033.1 hypothetical protein QPM16_10230 [Streptomyces anulatus]